MSKDFVVFDIETEPLDAETVVARSRPAKPTKEDLKKKTPEEIEAEHREACLEKAALAAETGKVLVIGVRGLRGVDGKPQLVNAILEGDETEVLRKFWAQYVRCRDTGRQLVGFNIFNFDLPFIVSRSWYTGVQVPRPLLDKNRFWNSTLVDLLEVWKMGRYRDYISLDIVSRCMGLAGKGGEVAGANFHIAWREQREKAVEYLHNDLNLTWEVGVRLGVIHD